MRSIGERDVELFEFTNFSSGYTRKTDHHTEIYELEELGDAEGAFESKYERNKHHTEIYELEEIGDIDDVFEVVREPHDEEEPPQQEKEEDPERKAAEEAQNLRADIINRYEEEALKLKQTIIESAEKEAEELKAAAKEAGYKDGYDEGIVRGKEQAYDEHSEELKKESILFLGAIKDFIERMENERANITAIHMENLKELVITIAEKVINVSLESSGDVIKSMLAVATEKIRDKQWAKIYISNHDESLMLEGDRDILDIVDNISEQVKVVIMENKPRGTCIIEVPDQIIDASVETQMENIKQVLNTGHI